MGKQERINKWLSEAGVCSRREVDQLIRDGRVEVDGRTATVGMTIDAEQAVVRVDGERVNHAHPERNALTLAAAEALAKQQPWWKEHKEKKRKREEALLQNPKSKLLRQGRKDAARRGRSGAGGKASASRRGAAAGGARRRGR